MLDVKALLTKVLKHLYKEYDQTVTVSLASMGSGYSNPTWGYATITAPSNVPTNAWAEMISTNGWGFLVRMASTTPPTYRFMALGATSGSRTITVRWHWHI